MHLDLAQVLPETSQPFLDVSKALTKIPQFFFCASCLTAWLSACSLTELRQRVRFNFDLICKSHEWWNISKADMLLHLLYPSSMQKRVGAFAQIWDPPQKLLDSLLVEPVWIYYEHVFSNAVGKDFQTLPAPYQWSMLAWLNIDGSTYNACSRVSLDRRGPCRKTSNRGPLISDRLKYTRYRRPAGWEWSTRCYLLEDACKHKLNI